MAERKAVNQAMAEIIWNSPHIKQSLANARNKKPEIARTFSDEQLRVLVHTAWGEMQILEKLAKKQEIEMRNYTLDSTLKRIGAIWTLSGPGLLEHPFKADAYQSKKWSAFMGRKRLMFSGFLMRKIAEVRSGIHFQEGIDLSRNDERNRDLIATYGPRLLFNGRLDENTDVEQYMANHELIVPPEKVHVLKDQVVNTLDQLRTLQQGEGQEFLRDLGTGSSLAIVTHVPHAVRLLHLLGRNNPFPPGLDVQLFPIPTSLKAVQAKRDDISGLLYYVSIGEATEQPFVPSNVDFSSLSQSTN